MQTASESIWQYSGRAEQKNSKRKHPGTEVRFTVCPTGILVTQLSGEGAVAWNGSNDWGWEQGGRRKAFPRPVFLPRPPQNLILCSVFYLGVAPLRMRCSGAMQGSVPWADFTASGHTNLSATKPVCHRPWGAQPQKPAVHRSQSTHHLPHCHLPNIPTGSPETNFDNSEPNS